MFPRAYSTRFVAVSFIISIVLHAMIVAAVFFIAGTRPPLPAPIPVNIVNLPPEMLNKLPPLRRPVPVPPAPPAVPRPVPPERTVRPEAVPAPKKFGTGDSVALPKTAPRAGLPGGAAEGKATGKAAPQTRPESGPLPFLSQNDIDELARKGMPEKQPGDDSVTLDTDEFKFISYNRWLKIKVESVLKYPELAAVSGYQGTLFIKFDIMKDGSLGGLELLKSSGYKILDDEALRAIRDSAPFQPLPGDWHMDRYSIRAAVIFYLGGSYIR